MLEIFNIFIIFIELHLKSIVTHYLVTITITWKEVRI